MGKTIIAPFDRVYCHIEAPTVRDNELGKEKKKWGRVITPSSEDDYTSEAVASLADAPWSWKRKYDGSNTRIKWDGEQAMAFGKTNNANMQSVVGFEPYIAEHFIEELFEEKFGRDKEVVLYGEWMGPKVQTNELGLDHNELVLFDVEIGKVFLKPEEVRDIAKWFQVPDFSTWQTGDKLAHPLGYYIHKCADGGYNGWEGIVVEPVSQLRDKMGNRIICKIKNRDYNLDNRS